MKHLSLILGLVIPALLFGQTPEWQKTTSVYDSEGRLQLLIEYKPSCSCRIYTEFFPDGKIYSKRHFKIEKNKEYIHGDDIGYHYSGRIRSFKHWADAVPTGRFYDTYPDGTLKTEGFYLDGYKYGIWKYFNEAGTLKEERIFDSATTRWNSEKESMIQRTYRSGKIVALEIWKNGKRTKSTGKEQNKPTQNPLMDITSGQKLFQIKCAACHSFDQDGYGPALKGVFQKRTPQWLYHMIKDGDALVKTGDTAAVRLFEQWHRKPHPPMDQLRAEQIREIIKFLSRKHVEK